MRFRWLMNSLLILTIVGGLFLGVGVVTAETVKGDDKVEASLLNEFSTQGQADFIVRFSAQPDLSPAYSMSWA